MNKTMHTIFFAVMLVVPCGLCALSFTFINETDDTIRLRIVEAKKGYSGSLSSLICNAKVHYITLDPNKSSKESKIKATCSIIQVSIEGFGIVWQTKESPRGSGTGVITKDDSKKYSFSWK